MGFQPDNDCAGEDQQQFNRPTDNLVKIREWFLHLKEYTKGDFIKYLVYLERKKEKEEIDHTKDGITNNDSNLKIETVF
jgi:hypothetical protein